MFRRLYHVSSVTCSFKKQGVKLWKMLNPKGKRNWYPTQNIENCNIMPSIKSLSKTTNEPGKRGIRRLSMLNKMFMKYITDIMSTGTVAMDVVGRGIEISKVNVTTDFQTVNVFWVCKGDSTDMETEILLNSIAGALRHELSTLRLMGEVPYIMFVKDIQEARRVDLDRRLAVADYGEDYSPTDLGHLLKSEFTLNTKLSKEVMAKIKQLEDQVPIMEDPVPEMTHHVFGLDHAAMMGRLLAARRRSADAWIRLREDAASPVLSYKTSAGAVQEFDVAEQSQELAEFLLKRQIQQNKLRKQMLNDKLDCLLPEESSDDENEEVPYDDDDEGYEDDASYYERHEAGADNNKHPSLS